MPSRSTVARWAALLIGLPMLALAIVVLADAIPDRFVLYRLRDAVEAGWTVSLGGDNSEPGMDGLHDAAVIPEWDIPSRHIDQESREMRIATGQTGDDHGVHAVGIEEHGGRRDPDLGGKRHRGQRESAAAGCGSTRRARCATPSSSSPSSSTAGAPAGAWLAL